MGTINLAGNDCQTSLLPVRRWPLARRNNNKTFIVVLNLNAALVKGRYQMAVSVRIYPVHFLASVAYKLACPTLNDAPFIASLCHFKRVMADEASRWHLIGPVCERIVSAHDAPREGSRILVCRTAALIQISGMWALIINYGRP
jgi:hypothetical protein